MEKVVVASNNCGKIKEIKEILKLRYEIISMSEAGINLDIVEDGNTFEENALIKAKTIFNILKIPVISDDSGICVDALNGDPGVYSARFAGVPCNDNNNNSLLLRKLKNEINRKAKFVSVVILYYGENQYYKGVGEVFGEILKQPDGNNGFGYDPLFYSFELKKSFGQATSNEKNIISHRARALIDLVNKII